MYFKNSISLISVIQTSFLNSLTLILFTLLPDSRSHEKGHSLRRFGEKAGPETCSASDFKDSPIAKDFLYLVGNSLLFALSNRIVTVIYFLVLLSPFEIILFESFHLKITYLFL